MDRSLLNKIKQSYMDTPLVKKTKDEAFAGVYLHSNSLFKKEDHEPSIRSFRLFSQYEYPLYLLLSLDAITEDVEYIRANYGDVRVIVIPRLNNIFEFNNFSINSLLYLINPKHNQLFYFQEDSGFVKEGFEELTSGYSWIGAPWKEPIKVIENTFNFHPIQIGNGGHNFRRRDKCLKVLDFVNQNGGQNRIVKGIKIDDKLIHTNSFLAEDAFFCYFGFGGGFFEPIMLERARKFSLEPITYKEFLDKKSCGFHRIDVYE